MERAAEEVRSQKSGGRTGRQPAMSFQDLIVWERAHQFVWAVYRCPDGFPKAEIDGLVSQLRREAVSILANVAEGFKKAGRADKVRFMNIAQGSLEECRHYLILSRDRGYGDTKPLTAQLEEVSKLWEAYATAIVASGA